MIPTKKRRKLSTQTKPLEQTARMERENREIQTAEVNQGSAATEWIS